MSIVVKEGALRKKGSHMSIWGTRYFVLRGSTLLYYSHNTDTESKGRYHLKKSCRITPIREEDYKRKKQYASCVSSGPSILVWQRYMAREGTESNNSKKKGLLKGDKAGEKERKALARAVVRRRVVIVWSFLHLTPLMMHRWYWLWRIRRVAANDSGAFSSGNSKKQVSTAPGRMNGNEVTTALSGGGVPHCTRTTQYAREECE